MKSYKIDVNGQPMTLRGLDNGVKQEIADRTGVQAERDWYRRVQKGYYATPEEATLFKPKASTIHFLSDEVIAYLPTDEGKRALYAAMLEAPPGVPVTKADIDYVLEQQAIEGSEIYIVAKQLLSDAFPKVAKAMPTSPPLSTDQGSPTSCGGSSATSHSALVTQPSTV